MDTKAKSAKIAEMRRMKEAKLAQRAAEVADRAEAAAAATTKESVSVASAVELLEEVVSEPLTKRQRLEESSARVPQLTKIGETQKQVFTQKLDQALASEQKKLAFESEEGTPVPGFIKEQAAVTGDLLGIRSSLSSMVLPGPKIDIDLDIGASPAEGAVENPPSPHLELAEFERIGEDPVAEVSLLDSSNQRAVLELMPEALIEEVVGDSSLDIQQMGGEPGDNLLAEGQVLEAPELEARMKGVAPVSSAAEVEPRLTVSTSQETSTVLGLEPTHVVIKTEDFKNLMRLMCKEEFDSLSDLSQRVKSLGDMKETLEGHDKQLKTLSEDIGHSFASYIGHSGSIEGLEGGLAACKQGLTSFNNEGISLTDKVKRLKNEHALIFTAVHSRLHTLEQLKGIRYGEATTQVTPDINLFRMEGYQACAEKLASRGCVPHCMLEDPN